MSIDAPLPLILALLLIAPAIVLLVRRERARQRDLARFGDPALLARSSALPTWRRVAAAQGLALAAIGLGMLALARPLGGDSSGTVRRAAGDVIFVLDLSRSMNAQDASPSRLGAAKRAAAAIASALPDDRVGLLVFGGTPFLSLPPTLDHSEFLRFLESASSEDLPDAATNIEVAAQMAAETLRRESDVRFGAAVLLSDGEDVEGKLEEAVKALRAGNVQTYTVGVGTTQGTTIPERDAAGVPGTHHDFAGREVLTQMNEGNLQRIASQAGGRFVHWQGEASVQPVIAGLKQLRRRGVRSRVRNPEEERFQWPLALAIVALLGETAVATGFRRRGT